jgi:predicted DNA-binding antitoxin AbrB/MazE fold protein
MGKVNLKEHEKVKLIIKTKELTENAELAVMSESSLKKDWLKTGEDEAGKDL